MVTDELAAGCAAATTEQQPTRVEPAPAVIVTEEVNDSAIARKLHLALNCRSRRANKTLEGPAGWRYLSVVLYYMCERPVPLRSLFNYTEPTSATSYRDETPQQRNLKTKSGFEFRCH
jgi:hypothetical protein